MSRWYGKKLEWEQFGDFEYRLRVPGGWIVKILQNQRSTREHDASYGDLYDDAIAAVFVPDPRHHWKID